MAPKRKAETAVNENVKTKIPRRDKDKTAPRNNILLFIQGLPDNASATYGDKRGAVARSVADAERQAQEAFKAQFTTSLSSAVSEALDPVSGPGAVMDFSKYGVRVKHIDFSTLTRVFGNQDAGDLMSVLFNSVDGRVADQLAGARDREDRADALRAQAEDALGRLQALLPPEDAGGRHTLEQGLAELAQAPGDAAWVYGMLWESVLLWMDTRMRGLRMFLHNVARTPATEPKTLRGRLHLVNGIVHGGNLRVDALMIKVGYPLSRHPGTQGYDAWMRRAFSLTYGLSDASGYWLAKACDMDPAVKNMDWLAAVNFIDMFVTVRDAAAQLAPPPPNLARVDAAYEAFTGKLEAVIGVCKKDGYGASDADLVQLQQLRDVVVDQCKQWPPAPRDRGLCNSLWERFFAYPGWAPAAHLQNTGPAPRIYRNSDTGATITLRRQARIAYNV